MATTSRTGEKRTAVEQLSFGSRTANRVTWEAFEFTVVGPYQVKVTNASYGYLKEDHSYVVGVEERGEAVLPAECECPADIHQDGACKHRVSLATVGGPTVLNAAVDFENPAPTSSDSDSMTAADRLRADGGNSDQREGEDKCGCTSELPCWDCFDAGRRDLPE